MSAHIQRRAARLPVGVNGEVLTPNDLPVSRPRRWIVKRKAQVVAAVGCGLLSVEEACSRYALTIEELLSWERDLHQGGLPGLFVKRVQDRRPRRAERQIRVAASN